MGHKIANVFKTTEGSNFGGLLVLHIIGNKVALSFLDFIYRIIQIQVFKKHSLSIGIQWDSY